MKNENPNKIFDELNSLKSLIKSNQETLSEIQELYKKNENIEKQNYQLNKSPRISLN